MAAEDEAGRRALLEEHAKLELEFTRVHEGSPDLAAHPALMTRLRDHSSRLLACLERLRSRHESKSHPDRS